jgi:hypothetical protein
MVYIRSPRLSSSYGAPYMLMGQSTAEAGAMEINGGTVALDLGATTPGVVGVAPDMNVTGDLTVGGSIKPATDWASGVSNDGIWINDGTTAARRWKLYMLGGQLIARYGSGGSEYHIIGP